MDNRLQEILAACMQRKLVCLDVGARGGLGYPWKQCPALTQAIYFEADPEEATALQQQGEGHVLPYALAGECGEFPLYLTAARRCSSFLEPDMDILAQYPESERFRVEKVITVSAVTLDHLYDNKQITHADFIKIDTQGTELDILQGAKKLVSDCTLGLEIEVSFKKLYKNQCFFHDIDAFVTKHLEMELFDLQKCYWKYSEGINTGQVRGQLIYGNALYFRSPTSIVQKCLTQADCAPLSTCAIALCMGISYGFIDYALRLLQLAREATLLSVSEHTNLLEALKAYGRTFRDGKGGKFSLGRQKPYNIGVLLSAAFAPSHGGWATSDLPLGSQKKYGFFV